LHPGIHPVDLLVHRSEIVVDVPHYVHELLILREFDGRKLLFLFFLIIVLIVIAF
jgi:hypothetical protein